MGLDVAKELNQMAAKHRLSAARPASSRESVGGQLYAES
jgi:hypothetical protein